MNQSDSRVFFFSIANPLSDERYQYAGLIAIDASKIGGEAFDEWMEKNVHHITNAAAFSFSHTLQSSDTPVSNMKKAVSMVAKTFEHNAKVEAKGIVAVPARTPSVTKDSSCNAQFLRVRFQDGRMVFPTIITTSSPELQADIDSRISQNWDVIAQACCDFYFTNDKQAQRDLATETIQGLLQVPTIVLFPDFTLEFEIHTPPPLILRQQGPAEYPPKSYLDEIEKEEKDDGQNRGMA